MVVIFALYLCALVGSVAFFLWSAAICYSRKRRLHRAVTLELGPDSEPAVFALYCQYLVAPQTAVREAQTALARARQRTSVSSSDFFVLLEELQSLLPASAKSR